MAALILFTGVNGTEETAATEYESKASLMLTFAEFIEWPAYVFSDAAAPIVLGVIGEDPFGDVLEKLKDHPVNSRKIEIRRFRGNLEFRGQETPGRRQEDLTSKRNRKIEQLKGCHILFIGESEQRHLVTILRGVQGAVRRRCGTGRQFLLQRVGQRMYRTEPLLAGQGAVQRHGVDDPAFQEIDNERTQTDFDRMSAHAQKNRLVPVMRPRDLVRDLLEAAGG